MNDILISGLCLDSRLVNPGDLFIAVRGNSQDGRAYIPMAIEKGAAAVLTETLEENLLSELLYIGDIPIIEFPDLRNSISHIASRFFSEPSKALKVIGITGTNGKTSCAQWLAQLLSFHQASCGVLGTLGNGFLNQLKTSDCTTPDPILTQRLLADCRDQGADYVAMEVTSHALAQGRVEGIKFQTAIFTNLTRDHLDYHQDMENYFLSKKRLFTELKPEISIINLDDTYGCELSSVLSDRVIGYSLQEKPPLDIPIIRATDIILEDEGLQAKLHSPWGEAQLESSLLGRFNLSNVLAVIAAVCVQGFSFQKTVEAVKSLKTVPGRMMPLGGGNQPRVVIDYAHTPDALAQVLTALRAHCQGQLWCVFGCGGDRDRGKRPQMAKVVEQFSDQIIVTQDNSRTESPTVIIHEILQGLLDQSRVLVEPDRLKAIQWAISNADPKDIILIAGKGHEEYQIVQTEKIPFSDQQVASQALSRRP